MHSRKIFRPDSFQTNRLIKAGRAAGIGARKDSRARGLTVTFIHANHVYREHADGTVERVGSVEQRTTTPVTLTKGMILRAR
jgi:hypothetical protein